MKSPLSAALFMRVRIRSTTVDVANGDGGASPLVVLGGWVVDLPPDLEVRRFLGDGDFAFFPDPEDVPAEEEEAAVADCFRFFVATALAAAAAAPAVVILS